jgi:hypothetical protein
MLKARFCLLEQAKGVLTTNIVAPLGKRGLCNTQLFVTSPYRERKLFNF